MPSFIGVCLYVDLLYIGLVEVISYDDGRKPTAAFQCLRPWPLAGGAVLLVED